MSLHAESFTDGLAELVTDRPAIGCRQHVCVQSDVDDVPPASVNIEPGEMGRALVRHGLGQYGQQSGRLDSQVIDTQPIVPEGAHNGL